MKFLKFFLAAVFIWGFWEFGNLAFYCVWQSAFTNANVEKLRHWFHFYASLSIACLILTILVFIKFKKQKSQ